MTVTAFNMISIIDLCVVWLEGKWTRLFSIDGRQNPIRVVGRVHEPNVSLYIDQWRWRETASCANPWSITSMPGVGNLKRRDQSVDKKL